MTDPTHTQKEYKTVMLIVAGIITGTGIGLLTGNGGLVLAWPIIGLGVGIFLSVWLAHSQRNA